MKVSELSGALLDCWVALAESLPLSCDWNQGDYILVGAGARDLERFSPSTYWEEGGPLIERERITLIPAAGDGCAWLAMAQAVSAPGIFGATPLIAAMRCYVKSKFGDEVADEVLT